MATNVRTFNGLSDFLNLAAGGVDSGYGTYLAIFKSASDLGNDTLLGSRSAGSDIIDLSIKGSSLSNAIDFYNGVSSGRDSTTPNGLTVANGWGIIAVTKATGTVVPRIHRCILSSVSWLHTNSPTSLANAAAGTGWRIGKWTDGSTNYDWLSGDLYCVSRWNASVLSDANLQTIVSLITLSALTPTNLWVFDQASTSTPVLDLMGSGADQIALTGTTVTSGVTIPNFNTTRPGPIFVPKTVVY